MTRKRFANLWHQMVIQKWTIRKMAKEIGMPERELGQKLNGKAEFTLKEMRALQAALGYHPLDYLFWEKQILPTSKADLRKFDGQSRKLKVRKGTQGKFKEIKAQPDKY